MSRLGTLLHTTKSGEEVYGVVMGDINSRKVYINIYIVSQDGEMSDFYKVTKSDIIKKENSCCDFLYDLKDFIKNDVDAVKEALKEVVEEGLEEGKLEKTQTRATLTELHEALSSYIRENEGKMSADRIIGIKGELGYISSFYLKDFIKKNKDDLGYKRIEALERLKIMGVLLPSSNRSYDAQVSIKGEKLRCYRIKLAEEREDAEEWEEIILNQKEVVEMDTKEESEELKKCA